MLARAPWKIPTKYPQKYRRPLSPLQNMQSEVFLFWIKFKVTNFYEIKHLTSLWPSDSSAPEPAARPPTAQATRATQEEPQKIGRS